MTIDDLHLTFVKGVAEPRRENHESRTAIDARFREQEETIRRLCDVMVEKVEALVRPVAEANAHLATVVGNHEVRLQAIEKRS